MNRQLVIARYKEDLSWLAQTDIPSIVYDKTPWGSPIPYKKNIKCQRLMNYPMGREAHTYLHHIVHNYDELAEWTFFLQGDPFYHYTPLYEALSVDYKDTTGLSLFIYTKENLRNVESQVQDYDSPILNVHVKRPRSKGWTTPFWRILFPHAPTPYELVFSSGAQFVVPRHRIQQRPLTYYKRLLENLESPCPFFDAWKLETFWLYIFGDVFTGGYPDRIRRTPPKLWT